MSCCPWLLILQVCSLGTLQIALLLKRAIGRRIERPFKDRKGKAASSYLQTPPCLWHIGSGWVPCMHRWGAELSMVVNIL